MFFYLSFISCVDHLLVVNLSYHNKTLSDAHVLLSLRTDSRYYPFEDGYVDENGSIEFNISSDDFYDVTIVKHGFRSFSKKFIVNCSVNCSVECSGNGDCLDDEICKNAFCLPLECGSDFYVDNHSCVPYNFTSEDDCLDNETYVNHDCVALTGTCGFAENHSWVNYDCCNDSDCLMTEKCMNHTCIKDIVTKVVSREENSLKARAMYRRTREPVVGYQFALARSSGELYPVMTDSQGFTVINISKETPVEISVPNKNPLMQLGNEINNYLHKDFFGKRFKKYAFYFYNWILFL